MSEEEGIIILNRELLQPQKESYERTALPLHNKTAGQKWRAPLIPALRRQAGDFYEFQANPVYKPGSRTARVIEKLCLKNQPTPHMTKRLLPTKSLKLCDNRERKDSTQFCLSPTLSTQAHLWAGIPGSSTPPNPRELMALEYY